jgi:hypothetical protein
MTPADGIRAAGSPERKFGTSVSAAQPITVLEFFNIRKIVILSAARQMAEQPPHIAIVRNVATSGILSGRGSARHQFGLI